MSGWHPTHAHLRAVVAGFGLLVAGLVLGRVDAIVLATPLLLVALAGAQSRPSVVPVLEGPQGALAVHEGEDVVWSATISGLPAGGSVAALHPGQRWLEVEPETGQVVAADDGLATTSIGLRPTRWGWRTLGAPAVTGYDAWAAWRWVADRPQPLRLTVLPSTEQPDTTAPAPHPYGLVGQERAVRLGEGTELAKVRPFEPGDRLRRIHWPTSARTGTLHVTATHADEDAHVVLLLDAVNDVGSSGGLVGERSSMDLAVRAAAVLAEHFLRRGDRVGLRVFGDWRVSFLPSSSGRHQLRRLLNVLSVVEPGTARGEDALAARQGLGAGTLAILLSPLVEPASTQQVAMLTSAGIEVIVVDTLPAELVTGDRGRSPEEQLAWRLRMLQRRLERDRMASLGIPVVTWTGPHSIDKVLRDLARRSATPRLVRR
ncbi:MULTISPECIES: DUF58 domain-containing protein [unclassified Nocardioides]|uniref:DUF58 domain-containing protein n=1 Tax=unclassified Nocardioides TaxID=2615069 RepID=UPI0007037E59|nr:MULTISPECIES: DUF58 domain-containing protein [unclassified Nocardioides]KRC54915.1 hypothetical protein ASE19_05530 [Nocardioides sp. Root79]KRC73741.1 hypothetical protein ASE20_03690 [Nocardioides sp. Root240]